MISVIYELIFSSEYADKRDPYLVPSSILEGHPATFLYTNDDSIILMNQDSFYSIDDSDQARRDTRLFANELYFEELGHFVEKWRCIKLNVSVSNCDTYGDAGARFSDAALINSPELVNDIEVYDEAIAKLSKNDMTYSSHLTMKSGRKSIL